MENAPGRMKPRRARADTGRGNPVVTRLNRQESNERALRRSGGRLGGASELARGIPQGERPWSEAASGGTRTRRDRLGHRNRPADPDRKERGGRRERKARFRFRAMFSDTGSQSQEGMRRREATRPLPGQALKGEPRGRARLRYTGEAVQGARRRGGQEPRGRNMTRGVEAPGRVALDGRVVPMGKETSRERSVRHRPRTGMPG